MHLSVQNSTLSGRVLIPASKSHTVRAVAIASMAEGDSIIRNPLVAADTLSAVSVYRNLGAEIETGENWIIHGTGGHFKAPSHPIDVGNSGTTLYIAMGSASLLDKPVVMTGDEQIQNRPAGPLLDALAGLGVQTTSRNGKPPLQLQGPIQGGEITLDGSKTSQYLTSLLINAPLAKQETRIHALNLTEQPYIQMTLDWLDSQKIRYSQEKMEFFTIQPNQHYHAFDRQMPGDFSSATFFLCAAAVTGSNLILEGLDIHDSQGDKAVIGMLQEMGAEVTIRPEGIQIQGGSLHGADLDLNATPDALPALAVTACFVQGETRLINVAQARLKETDRIRVMCEELTKMGASIQELPDGLIIHGSPLRGAKVHGWNDHRVVMALAVAGMASEGVTEIDTAEAMQITFPNFVELMAGAGACITINDNKI